MKERIFANRKRNKKIWKKSFLQIEKEIKRYERNDVKSRRRVPTLDPRDQSKWTAVGLVAIAWIETFWAIQIQNTNKNTNTNKIANTNTNTNCWNTCAGQVWAIRTEEERQIGRQGGTSKPWKFIKMVQKYKKGHHQEDVVGFYNPKPIESPILLKHCWLQLHFLQLAI